MHTRIRVRSAPFRFQIDFNHDYRTIQIERTDGPYWCQCLRVEWAVKCPATAKPTTAPTTTAPTATPTVDPNVEVLHGRYVRAGSVVEGGWV